MAVLLILPVFSLCWFYEVNLCRMYVFWFLVGYSIADIMVINFVSFIVFSLMSYVTVA
jgi:hypothetical protein